MRTDFGRITLALKVLMQDSEVDRPDLTPVLLKSQALFLLDARSSRSAVVARARLRGVDFATVLGVFGRMRFELYVALPLAAGD